MGKRDYSIISQMSFLGPVLWACERPVTFTSISSCINFSAPSSLNKTGRLEETGLKRVFFPHDSGQGSDNSFSPWIVALCYRKSSGNISQGLLFPPPSETQGDISQIFIVGNWWDSWQKGGGSSKPLTSRRPSS